METQYPILHCIGIILILIALVHYFRLLPKSNPILYEYTIKTKENTILRQGQLNAYSHMDAIDQLDAIYPDEVIEIKPIKT